MAAFKINLYSGIRPRVPESLLPEGAATIAQNCDFAYGELRNTKGGYLVNTMSNSPKSIYTDDGLTFYTWTGDVDAVRSPLVSDTFNRLYYTDGAAMKVTSRISTSLTGGPPGSSYNVGVARPSVAPSLAVTLPDVANTSAYTLVFKFHYEYGGVKYQEQTITPTVLGGAQYRFTPPAMNRQVSFSSQSDFPEAGESGVVYKASDTGTLYTWNGSVYVTTSTDATPTQAFPVLRCTATTIADNSQLFDIYSDNSSLDSTGGIWSLAIVNDSGASTYTATLTTAIKEADKETRAYVYVFRNTYDESGPPSAPTTVNTSPVVGVNVVVTKDAVGSYAPIKAIDIYRTPTGSTIADYFYVGSIDVLSGSGTFTFADTTKAEQLNEALSSTNFYPPPSGLVGLMSLPNGILCAWKGNELWFSEAYKPWAWPPQYVKPLPATIVGGIVHGSSAVITTVKHPHIVSGVSPDSMTTTKLNVDQAGVSKWSIAVVDGTVMYASNDGLVTISGATASLAQGQKFFTREVWRQRYEAGLSGMRFSVWDGRLVVFHGTASFTPFMIRFDEADGTMTDLPDLTAACAFISQLSDQFYYAQGTGLYQFNGGADQTAVWQSREAVLNKPTNYGILQSVCTGSWTLYVTVSLSEPPDVSKQGTFTRGAWTVTISSTEVIASTTLVAGTKTLRMVDGFESDRWKIKLTGTGRFRELRMATTGRELATV
jgi:hypothetical protein